jgi:predicted nucleic acid-binding protein
MNYTRIMADTNVTVSAFLWGGQPRRLLDLGIDQQITLLTDTLLAELADVLSREQFLPRLLSIGMTAEELVSAYRRFCELAPPTEITPAVHLDTTMMPSLPAP